MVEVLIVDNNRTRTELPDQTETTVDNSCNVIQELLDKGVKPGRELFDALNKHFARPSRWAHPHPANVVKNE